MEDLNDLFAYARVPGVGEMAGWPHHTDVEISRGILRKFIEDDCIFAVVPHDTGRMSGSLGIHVSWANDEPDLEPYAIKEIGYVLAQSRWGEGLMPEAVRAVIDWAFGSLALDGLTVGHFVENAQSRRVIEKCGFAFHSKSVYHARRLNLDIEDMRYILMNPALGLPAAPGMA